MPSCQWLASEDCWHVYWVGTRFTPKLVRQPQRPSLPSTPTCQACNNPNCLSLHVTRSGMALHGRQGAKWSEVAAAHALLGYERREAGICPVILHPTHGQLPGGTWLFSLAMGLA